MEDQPAKNQNRLKQKAALIGLGIVGVVYVGNQITDLVDDTIGFLKDIPALVEQETTLEIPEPINIVEIEPINFDCRSRTTMTGEIEGTRDNKVFGLFSLPFNDDTVEVDFVGDIITCIDGGPEIINLPTGSIVMIDEEDIVFEQPRVDFVGTVINEDGEVIETQADESTGYFNNLIDSLPLFEYDTDLRDEAYELGQKIVGSSECMVTAYDTTKEAIKTSYAGQGLVKGQNVSVIFHGEPNFEKYELNDEDFKIGDAQFNVVGDAITCVVSDGAYDNGDTVQTTSTIENEQNETVDLPFFGEVELPTTSQEGAN